MAGSETFPNGPSEFDAIIRKQEEDSESRLRYKSFEVYDKWDKEMGSIRVHCEKDGEPQTYFASQFENIEHICKQMDDESARDFHRELGKFHDERKLLNLASPEVRKCWEEARQSRIKELEEEKVKLEAASLTSYELAEMVTVRVLAALSVPELRPFLQEMANRRQLINHSVVSRDDNREMVALSINPTDLIEPDVSDQVEKYESLEEEFNKDFKDKP